jgi:hypothetical protein
MGTRYAGKAEISLGNDYYSIWKKTSRKLKYILTKTKLFYK